MNTPVDHLPIFKKPPTRPGKILLTKTTKATHSFLFLNGKICELTGSMLTTRESEFTASPTMRSNEELEEILKITELNYLRELVQKKNFKNLDKCQIRRREVKFNPNFLSFRKLDIIPKGR